MKRIILIAGSLLLLIAVIVTSLLLFFGGKNKHTNSVPIVTPHVKMLLGPNEKGTAYQWLTSPDGSLIFTYHTAIDNIAISVSEQDLPSTFLDDPESNLAKLATSYQATNKLTATDTKAYIGASASGIQTVLAIKSERLLLITSEATIADTSWSNYLSGLKLTAIDN